MAKATRHLASKRLELSYAVTFEESLGFSVFETSNHRL